MSEGYDFYGTSIAGLEKSGEIHVTVNSGLSKYQKLKAAVKVHCTHCAVGGGIPENCTNRGCCFWVCRPVVRTKRQEETTARLAAERLRCSKGFDFSDILR